jgi:peptidyl-dipeptidase A
MKNHRFVQAAAWSALLLLMVSTAVRAREEKTLPQSAPSADEAREFVEEASSRLLQLSTEASRAEWVKSTYITDDTEILAAHADQAMLDANVRYAKQAASFDEPGLPPEVARELKILKLALTTATPSDPKEGEDLTRTITSMEGAYGKGKYCPPGAPSGQAKCLDIEDITRIMAESRDPAQLLDVWRGWHAVSPPYRQDFARYVALANKGARQLGFADNGAMWRSGYDMPPDDFAREVDRLWEQVRPLYLSLHAYVRWKLREKYGDRVPASGPIPADMLGNIWAQSWENVYPLVEPAGSTRGYDLTQILKDRHTDYKQMVRYGEGFFTSLGFPPLPGTFWERSMLTKPADRDVVCHASAWHIDLDQDVRLKMCIDITAEDFNTVHHELGHNYYQLAYSHQPVLFRDGANDGFHEAIGDTIALSITPEYLVKLGLLDKAPDASGDIGLLLSKALEKVSFLPFGLMIDKWRWEVFSGEIPPDKYNQTWWDMRLKYQGVAPPVARSEADFDPGAKYHVAANVPYMRYFLADILQFQFHRSLAQAAGCPAGTPLHRCSIYGNAEAGKRLRAMLALGKSEPWPDALEAMTGQRQMDATAILDYFAPLKKWLDEQNQGHPVGW